MVKKERVRTKAASIHPALQESPEITRFLRELQARYADSALSLEELQKRLHEELGDISLSQELRRMRDE